MELHVFCIVGHCFVMLFSIFTSTSISTSTSTSTFTCLPSLPPLPSLGAQPMRKIASRDKLKRLAVVAHEIERNSLRFITHCELFPLEVRMKAQFRLAEIPRQSSEHFHRRRCINTGNPRQVVADFNLSRHEFKRMATDGNLPGVIKAKW